MWLTYTPDPEEEAAVAVVVLRRLVLLRPADGGQLLSDGTAVRQGVSRQVLKGRKPQHNYPDPTPKMERGELRVRSWHMIEPTKGVTVSDRV